MRMTEIDYDDHRPPIDGYGPGFFRIEDEVRQGHLLLLPAGMSDWGGLDDAAPLVAAAGEVDVLFIGTGADIAHLPDNLAAALKAAGVAYEIMPTPGACRTYNILLSEGRRIGAALIAV